MPKSVISALFLVLTSLLPSILAAAPAKAAAESGRVIINEIRLGGDPIGLNGGGTLTEYITLFNSGSTAVVMDGWVLEYAKAASPALDAGFCGGDWQSSAYKADVAVTITPLDGIGLQPGEVSVPIERQLNDTGGGALRLVETTPDNMIVHDLVGWGSGTSAPPCQEGEPAQTPSKPNSLRRYLECDGTAVIDTNDNKSDFVASSANPTELGGVLAPDCSAGGSAGCSGLIVTEILPNPTGTDSGNEFIEIHNPTTSAIGLDGCAVTVGGKTFDFPLQLTLVPGQFMAFYDAETKLTLANSAGGTVMLSTLANNIDYLYPANLGDGISWSFIDNLWQATDNITPNTENKPASIMEEGKGSGDEELTPCQPNQFRNPETNRCKLIASESSLTPCLPDQYRNPATNRCKKIEGAIGTLGACDAGQYRNPETNRCKSLVTASSALKPCNPGQERNPATNRCRSVLSASSELKPCQEGQERNPETNRCRKVATLASATGDPEGSEGSGSGNKTNYAIVGTVAALATGYGFYEYRTEIRNKFASAKNRIFSSSGSN